MRAILAVSIVAALVMTSLCAETLAPYDPTYQQRQFSLISPTRVHWGELDGKRALYVQPTGSTEKIPVRLFAHGSAYKWLGFIPSDRHLLSVAKPGELFLLGTDVYGRDLFSRFICGARISLSAGLLATLISLLAGFVLGSLAGYYGSWLDAATTYGADLFLVLPWIYLLFIVRAFLPLHVPPLHALFLIVGVIGLLGWAKPAKLVRGSVLSIKERSFVLAARSFGASDIYLIRRHVFPELRGLLLTQASLLIPQYIMAEVTLTFLGLGVSEPTPSWGSLLANLQDYHTLVSCWWMFLPAIMLFPIFLCFALINGPDHTSANAWRSAR